MNFLIKFFKFILRPLKRKELISKEQDLKKKKDPDKTDDIYPLW